MNFKKILLIYFIFFFNFIYSEPTIYNEYQKIIEISPQSDWDLWLLGYAIKLNDGSKWFSERGPMDHWEWQVGDEISIDIFNNQKDRRVLKYVNKPALGDVDYRIININRSDFDEFQLKEPPELSMISDITGNNLISLANHSQWLVDSEYVSIIKNWRLMDIIIYSRLADDSYLINDRVKEMVKVQLSESPYISR